MLKQITIKNYKSLRNVTVDLPRLTVLFGPNAAGKSNFLDAVQAFSRISTSRTLSDALSESVRGYPVEAFTFPTGGLTSLLSAESAQFSLGAELETGKKHQCYHYEVSVQIQPGSGSLSIINEYLAKNGELKGKPFIEKVEDHIHIQRKSKPADPHKEPVGLNYAVLSDPRFSGIEYRHIEQCRNEMSGWRTYYLDPMVAMRSAKPPSDVRDIGVMGDCIAPFLFRLKSENPKYFAGVKRGLRTLIPGVEDLTVDLDKKRGVLDISIRQDGTDYSIRIISEGTLRVLALCAIAANPWEKGLITFEEPENGIDPRRLDLVAELLASLALYQGRQVIVTTHSPLLCNAVLQRGQSCPAEIALFKVGQINGSTMITSLDIDSLFQDSEITQALTDVP